ncbi:hypothetical protein EOC93_12305 [Mesorhizobium sp. M6A.T.Ce.TU.002.03.1.1]|uniref:hypothetical protein n=1 Tax=Mesorhizobium sp. M6A.T.Ce.TU.002.03.1.1 TaxID=2496782 RepID=UPI000FCC2FA2|nr:hypothetical protein [Mesorhizobium sp. M6A.T.Ce.TU.002.03.1.1]RUU38986.1 hypothetical protein EOD08_15045 [Mesorhizobium sp. M6A.T.Ca.TU.002.02.2.1]RUU44159.1 hypothetical protein EOC93_12305 [Mesorhizobium sp. M6A.T.Ce.TU.002.03.1.1]
MIFIVANPQADGGSVGGDRSFLSQETGTFVRYPSWRNRFYGCSATAPSRDLMGSLGSHPAAPPITAQHPQRQAALKSLALPANPWDDAFGQVAN